MELVYNLFAGIFNSDEFDGVIRHALTTAGGAVVASGVATQDQWSQIIGGVVVGVTILWSVASKTYLKNKAAVNTPQVPKSA